MCSEQENRKENFTFCFDACKMTKFFKCFRMGISKFEKFKELLLTDSQKKKTQWRRRLTTQRLTITVRLVHATYNLLSPSPSEQLNTSQKEAAFWLTTFVNVRLVAGRSRTWAGRPQAVERHLIVIHIRYAVPLPCCVVAFKSRF